MTKIRNSLVTRWLKISTLVVSHLVVGALAAALAAGYFVRREFQRAHDDPLARLGMRFAAAPEELDAFGSLDDDVRAASKAFGPTTQQVLQLVGELRSNDMTGATRTCLAMRWPDCEPGTLNRMRKALLR